MAVFVLLLLKLVGLVTAHRHLVHKICVPETAIEACKRMVEQAKTVEVNLECLPARDRVDCLYKVKDHEADFEPVEPEDMYIAAQLSNEAFSVFKEIRTKEEPSAEFRYEAVVVIHKDLDIHNVKSMKGLKSCHTGVGRNVGYKIPITKLTKMGVLGPLSDTTLSPRENELKALSTFFSKSCLVGQWSPHPETNARLKKTYSNLCELCENPEKCDYPDANSGYEGALRCLAKAGGDVAFTKVIYVKKFFGMPYGNQPAAPSEYNPDDFAYFCPDGSKKPITGTPCTWAARPWPGFMASTHIDENEIKELREEIAKLNNLGESKHADWIATVLTMNNKTLAVDNTPQSPVKYLEKAQYMDVIERDVLEPRRVVRLCVETKDEMEKCDLLRSAAYSRDIRPSLSCVQSSDCVQSVVSKEAEIVVLHPQKAINSESKGLKPLLSEEYKGHNRRDIVAVAKKGSGFKSIEELKGKRACLPYSKCAGFRGVYKYMLEKGMLSKTGCPNEKSFDEFFSSTVVSKDPLKCIEEGQGDVAFVPQQSLNKHHANNYELVCSSGGPAPIDKDGCGVVTIPPKMVMTRKDISEVQIDEVRQSMLTAANLYGKHPDLFQLFGNFKGQPNVIFSNYATGLVSIPEGLQSYDGYKKLTADLVTCQE